VAITLGLIAVVIIAVVAYKVTRTHNPTVPPSCRVAVGATIYSLEVDQAANATTIAAVGKQRGLPDHAVTIGLAAAMQESRLHNLGHGDLDSLGLFQQRPSQGWGTPSQVQNPRYAASAFFDHLALVSNWQTLSVTEAAQQVQHSAAPGAYAQWESEARALAQAMTGEVPAGLSCRFQASSSTTVSPSLEQTMAAELGGTTLGAPLPAPRGWTVATWLVGHAQPFGLRAVIFAGQRWTPSAGAWTPYNPVDTQVRVVRTPPAQ
jgi:hypothetical protein